MSVSDEVLRRICSYTGLRRSVTNDKSALQIFLLTYLLTLLTSHLRHLLPIWTAFTDLTRLCSYSLFISSAYLKVS